MKRVSVDVVESLDQPIRKGIDAIYEFSNPGIPPPPPKYIISEVKYGTADLKWNKSKTIKQMDDTWIRKNIDLAVGSRLMAKNILNDFYPVLTKVEPKGTIINTKLDSSANKVKTAIIK
ncbi:MAG: hypothetical protein KIS94_05165 [Chitinophagales bacterium]|nr:hypothetical protein [Chitinophagales bacterium]